ncbi:MAG: hypothetical protein JW939_03440 [Candidatus Thermoplasmatota archaeon]|nr:hypothetical protein [Candidatus Thermoplasmatota archaeon]
MSLLSWLLEEAHVQREVSFLYLAIVTAISLGVLFYALRTRNRNALYLYLFSLPVWGAIEGIGLLTGWRQYSASQALVYVVVSFMENPGWVTLAYIMSEKMLKWWKGRPNPSAGN